MSWARILADLIVVVHAAYFSFVVLGLLVILLGIAFRWGWVRNAWFRSLHLAAIGFVVFEAVIGMTCPLTHWEKRFRELAGEAAYPGDFIGHWAHELIFFDGEPWVITAAQGVFGLAVLAAFILAPPRWRRPSIEAAGTIPQDG
ncbi:MAG: DUF2784 domain-containing protein [Isosphaeraceae bacterium]